MDQLLALAVVVPLLAAAVLSALNRLLRARRRVLDCGRHRHQRRRDGHAGRAHGPHRAR